MASTGGSPTSPGATASSWASRKAARNKLKGKDKPQEKRAEMSPEELEQARIRLIGAQLRQNVEIRAPPVPDHPAPPTLPPRSELRVPASLLAGPGESILDRKLKSSVGRAMTFVCTILCFSIAGLTLIEAQSLQRQLKDESPGLWLIAIFSVATLYALLPKLANKTGMKPDLSGIGWKPYFVMYRLSFLTAIPALVLLAIGYGAAAGFGEQSGEFGNADVRALAVESGHYFQAFNGFVALNLSIGVVETNRVHEHGPSDERRRSNFRDAGLKINNEPFVDQPEPTLAPDMLMMYKIAPVFAAWDDCLSRYRISIDCQYASNLVGWAITQTSSLCTNLRMISCNAPEPELKPVYKCTSADKISGAGYTGPVEGLCGRVVMPPPEDMIDEARALFTNQGWRPQYMPNSSHIWIDVREDECIDDPDTCNSRWSNLGAAGLFFALLTVGFIIAAASLDCYFDKQIRQALAIYEVSSRRKRSHAGDGTTRRQAPQA